MGVTCLCLRVIGRERWKITHSDGVGRLLILLGTLHALFGGNGETGFEQNSTYSVFSISITLTDEGYEQIGRAHV